MFVLIWATLLYSVTGSDAGKGAPAEGKEHCLKNFCITLNEGEITAEAGLCVVIPCSFSPDPNFTTKHIIWYKCDAKKPRCGDDVIFHTNKSNPEIQPGFRGRVSLLEPDVNQRNCSIIINDLTESDSGSYQLRVNGLMNGKSDGLTFTKKKATISVKDLIQKPTLMIPPLREGKQTTLTCTAPGLCSGSVPQITWMWRGAGERDSHITGNVTAVAQRYSSTLTFDPSAEHHGTNVTCKVSFTNNVTAEETVTLNVTLFPKILKDSGCKVQSGVLTCVCISQGFPLPTIKWPLLDNLAEYSVITVSNHTVNSTITLTVKDHSNTTVECVSSNEKGEVQQNIDIMITPEGQGDVGAVNITGNTSVKDDETSVETVTQNVTSCSSPSPHLLEKLLQTVQQPEVIIAFVTGILLSAVICCLVTKCRRKKQRSAENMAESLEMITTQEVAPLTDRTRDQQAAKEAEATGQSVINVDVEPKEVEYSDINFSRLNRRRTGEEDTRESTETEYAEIKTEDIEKRQDNGREDGEILEGKEKEEEEEKERVEELKEEEEVVGQDKETKECMSAEKEEGEDVPVYSNVKEIMAEI